MEQKETIGFQSLQEIFLTITKINQENMMVLKQIISKMLKPKAEVLRQESIHMKYLVWAGSFDGASLQPEHQSHRSTF